MLRGARSPVRMHLTAEEAILLILLREDRTEAMPLLLNDVHPGLLLERLNRLRLTPLLGPRLLKAAPSFAKAAVGTSSFGELVSRRVAGAGRAANTLQMVGDHLLERFEAGGVRAAPLKGPWSSERLHGDAGLRESTDIDVLVAPEDLGRAVRLTREMGWSAPLDWVDRSGRPRLHFELRHPGGLPSVELHWRVHWYEREFARRALDRALDDGRGRRLAVSDELLFALLFYARDGLSGLRLAADVLAAGRGHHDVLGAVRHACGVAPPLTDAFLAPLRTVSTLGRKPEWMPQTTSRRVAVACTFADPFARLTLKQSLGERALMDVLLAPSGERLRALRRQVVPPAGVIRHHMSSEPGHANVIGLATAEHAARTLRRFALAPLIRLRHDGTAPPSAPGEHHRHIDR